MAAKPGPQAPPHAPFPVGPLHNKATSEPRVGDTCPVCKEGRLDYDGLLNLACTQCGYSLAGCFT